MQIRPQLVLIEWVDSGQPIPSWQWLSEIGSRRAHKCVSVGFLVQDDENAKVLAPNLGASNGDDEWDQASGLMTIPTASVLKIVSLISSSTASTCGLAAA
ncbi:hypothetical protein [Bradyrhizobium sp. WD16]|uniref:hypothetical protein n=1 Tax=Bradyrhizobium sp. WD16 TaxID=1521768 RepID=UPI0020A5D053|nr:hypothetical protein [Bradyrhizobium sp. WD16]